MTKERIMDKLKLITVYTAQGMLPAQVIKGKLESANIPVMLKYESAGQIFGLTIDGLGQVQVQVPAEFAEESLALIDEDAGAVYDEEPVTGEGPDPQ
jgi:hypothetical protein